MRESRDGETSAYNEWTYSARLGQWIRSEDYPVAELELPATLAWYAAAIEKDPTTYYRGRLTRLELALVALSDGTVGAGPA